MNGAAPLVVQGATRGARTFPDVVARGPGTLVLEAACAGGGTIKVVLDPILSVPVSCRAGEVPTLTTSEIDTDQRVRVSVSVLGGNPTWTLSLDQ